MLLITYIQLSLFGKTSWERFLQMTGWTLEPVSYTHLYGLWGQEELTQQEIAGRLGISRSYVYRHIYCK